jgi:hypothetical protein
MKTNVKTQKEEILNEKNEKFIPKEEIEKKQIYKVMIPIKDEFKQNLLLHAALNGFSNITQLCKFLIEEKAKEKPNFQKD